MRPSDRAVSVAKKTLAKIAAYDPYFANPNPATLMAWAEHITLRNMQEEEMLEAVSRFYEGNTDVKPLPAAISNIAVELRRNRPESDDVRAEREARIDAKVEGRPYYPDAPVLPGRVPAEKITMAEWQRRHGEPFPVLGFAVDDDRHAAELSVRCPWCKQPPGRRCTVAGTAHELQETPFHDARSAVVEKRCAAHAGWHVNPHSDYCDLGGLV